MLLDPFHSICLKFWILGSPSLAGLMFFSISIVWLYAYILTICGAYKNSPQKRKTQLRIAVLIVQALFQERVGKISGRI